MAVGILRNIFHKKKKSRIFRFWIYFERRDIDGCILGDIINVRAYDILYVHYGMKRRLI